MKILITGHCGFIGRNVFAELSKHHECVGIDRLDGTGYDLISCPLPDVDLVIHLAASAGVKQSLRDPETYWTNNVDVSRRIFDHYSRTGTRVIYASSSSAKQWFKNPYAMTKKVVEQFAPPMSCGLRFHTVYGPNSRPDMLFDKILTRSVTYTTEHYRDFTHVNDVVSAIKCVIDNRVVGIIDVGTGNPVSVSVLVAAAGLSVPTIKLSQTPHEATRTQADPKELLALGWRPKHDVIQQMRHECIKNREFNVGRPV